MLKPISIFIFGLVFGGVLSGFLFVRMYDEQKSYGEIFQQNSRQIDAYYLAKTYLDNKEAYKDVLLCFVTEQDKMMASLREYMLESNVDLDGVYGGAQMISLDSSDEYYGLGMPLNEYRVNDGVCKDIRLKKAPVLSSLSTQ